MVYMQSITADLVRVVSTRLGYYSLLCTTVADIEKFQFLDFLKMFVLLRQACLEELEAETPTVVI